METEKSMRLLSMYQQLMSGEGICKKEAAEQFGVDKRSIQRDIDSLRKFFENQAPSSKIVYNSKSRRHELVSMDGPFFCSGEILALCKILLGSHALIQEEMNQMLSKLLACCASKESDEQLRQAIANERKHYWGPHHGKALIDRLWTLQQAVANQQTILAEYRTQAGARKLRRLHPVGLIFSELYFYLTAYIEGRDEASAQFQDPSPTIYRVDRLEKIEVLEEHFSISYGQRFEEGEFRKRVQFMYGGQLRVVRFRYTGPSVEAVLDRLPTAEILSKDDDGYHIRVEVLGDGIDMWLRSQGNYVQLED